MGLERLNHRFRRWLAAGDSLSPSFGWAVLVFAAALSAGMGLLSDRHGLLDWDTYTRIHFIESYRPDLHIDAHLLYHHVQAWLMGVIGLTPIRSALLVTAMSYAAFVTVMFSLCRREELSHRQMALVLGMTILGSPGLFWEFLAAEDNVAYLPVLALLFYWLPQPTRGTRENLYVGVACGALVALGMLINITSLVFLFAILAAPLLAWGGQKSAAVRLVVMSVVAIGLYYLSFLTVFYGCRIALHEYLPEALRLQNFDSSSGSIFSALRLEHYVVGFKSIAWLPTTHFMFHPDGNPRHAHGLFALDTNRPLCRSRHKRVISHPWTAPRAAVAKFSVTGADWHRLELSILLRTVPGGALGHGLGRAADRAATADATSGGPFRWRLRGIDRHAATGGNGADRCPPV